MSVTSPLEIDHMVCLSGLLGRMPLRVRLKHGQLTDISLGSPSRPREALLKF